MKRYAARIFVVIVSAMATLTVKAAAPANPLPERQAVISTCPLTATKPQGWMRRCLETQYAGLTGHVEDLKGRSFEEVICSVENISKVSDGPYLDSDCGAEVSRIKMGARHRVLDSAKTDGAVRWDRRKS